MLNLVNKTHTILPFVLGGGSGTRLWPLSRKSMPKQFISLPGSENSMIQDTLEMLLRATDTMPTIIGSEAHRFVIAEQAEQALGTLPKIVLEPQGRDSAAAVISAALIAQHQDEQAIVAVCPSDHRVDDLGAFSKALQDAAAIAATGKVVTLGIKATRPSTAFGYIQRGTPIDAVENSFAIAQFHEKPDAETAASYIATGEFSWNAGMFILRADAFLAEASELCPEIVSACRKAISEGQPDLDFCRLDAEAWAEVPAIAFDHAFMEKSQNTAVVEVDFNWADLGSFEDLYRVQLADADTNGNVTHGTVSLENTNNCLIHSTGPAVIATGVEDLIIVVENDAVLISKQGETAAIKMALPKLAEQGVSQATDTKRCHRPWGWYETIAEGERYQTKEIMVKPGGQLSLQSHFHRSEHWVVASGTARITIGEHVGLYRENQSVYVPLGEVHRLENPGKLPMRLIEVQSGGYLGEDDIVRYEDVYGRPERDAVEAA